MEIIKMYSASKEFNYIIHRGTLWAPDWRHEGDFLYLLGPETSEWKERMERLKAENRIVRIVFKSEE